MVIKSVPGDTWGGQTVVTQMSYWTCVWLNRFTPSHAARVQKMSITATPNVYSHPSPPKLSLQFSSIWLVHPSGFNTMYVLTNYIFRIPTVAHSWQRQRRNSGLPGTDSSAYQCWHCSRNSCLYLPQYIDFTWLCESINNNYVNVIGFVVMKGTKVGLSQ